MSEQNQHSDEHWMQLAFEQAAQAAELQEIPVGAVIVSQNQVIGAGFNAPISLKDPTAHAEVQALRQACLNIDNYRLPDDATLYVTLEPCTMCVGALVHSRIKRVVFATTEPKAGSLVSSRQLLNSGYYNHIFEFEHGCLQEQCSQQLSDFFKMRREQKRLMKLQEKATLTELNLKNQVNSTDN
ncbi:MULTISPECIES: tRNA adenosine(34) deaminase TadA [unclassified Acinetobacter]|uniref:tRNA adenosine(34) deaminase TadA n=1 Tax=unclassified Acinetobacter TaxID=196816 RepID=UPI0015D1E022|nr:MULTISPECIES: tRNA adenosine(34) deaminase TadA [unclassified Acinetobacter]UUS59731.1 tRNA adenosine(34) deaminase TadA [Acinetobacter sp. YH16056_T]